MKKIVVICGPTASRKSELAVGVAKRLCGELVCCDSVQLFRGFRIGTAAPTDEEMSQVPHHLFGELEAEQLFDAGQYARAADQVIDDLTEQGILPVIVGGTGLYLRSLLWGLAEVPSVSNDVRERLMRELERDGKVALYDRLVDADPTLAAGIEGGPANTQRVLRGLEVFEGTGRPLSEYQKKHQPDQCRYDVEMLMPCFPPERLAERINARVDRMMETGFKEEVEALLAQGIAVESRPMQALGYRQMVTHLQGELSLEETVRQIKFHHRKYAKRQRTWFRGVKTLKEVNGESASLLDDALQVLDL